MIIQTKKTLPSWPLRNWNASLPDRRLDRRRDNRGEFSWTKADRLAHFMRLQIVGQSVQKVHDVLIDQGHADFADADAREHVIDIITILQSPPAE